jgi:hypothetical protein
VSITTDMVETVNLKVAGPSIRLAPSYAGWLRRFALKQDDVKAAVLRNAAEVIDQQRVEIHRLSQALEDASGVGVLKDKTVSPSPPEQKGQT